MTERWARLRGSAPAGAARGSSHAVLAHAARALQPARRRRLPAVRPAGVGGRCGPAGRAGRAGTRDPHAALRSPALRPRRTERQQRRVRVGTHGRRRDRARGVGGPAGGAWCPGAREGAAPNDPRAWGACLLASANSSALPRLLPPGVGGLPARGSPVSCSLPLSSRPLSSRPRSGVLGPAEG